LQVLKYYVFWGIFALVLIGIGFSLWDRRRRSQKARELEAAYRAAAAARAMPAAPPAPADAAAASPLAAPAFDPHATRIHYRGAADGGAHAPLPARDAEPLPPEKTAKLVCVGGSLKHRSFPITAAGLTVGREPKNDVVIADPRTSYHHAWIGIIDHKVVLRDLGSTNGTFLNTQIDSPVGEVVLTPGDMIFFGGHGRDQFLFVVD
jgi:FHA domain